VGANIEWRTIAVEGGGRLVAADDDSEWEAADRLRAARVDAIQPDKASLAIEAA